MKPFDEKAIAALCGTWEGFRLFRDLDRIVFPSPESEVGKGIVEAGEALLSSEPVMLPLSDYRRFSEDGDRVQFEQKYFSRRHAILTLTLAERIEGKGRFLRKLCDYLWAVLEETTWVIPAHNRSFADHNVNAPIPDAPGEIWYIDLFSAGTAGLLSVCLYLVGDALEKEIPALLTRRIRCELRRRVLEPYKNYNDQWWRGYVRNDINNWCPWVTSNVLLTSAVLSESLEERRYFVKEALFSLNVFADTYGADGGCNEGPGYWGLSCASLYDCLELLYDMTDGQTGDLFTLPLVKNMCDSIRRVHIAGNYFFNCADAHPKIACNGRVIERMGVRTGNAVLRDFSVLRCRSDLVTRLSQSGKKPLFNADLPYRSVRDLLGEVCRSEPYRPPLSEFLPDLQFCAMREKRQEDAGLYFAMKGGHNAENHNHNDVGSFVLYADGEPVLIDAGVGTYTRDTFSAKRFQMFAFRSQDHNLPIVCGKVQTEGLEKRAGRFSFDESARTVVCELSRAYDDPEGVIRSYERKSTMTDGALVLDDTIDLCGEGEAEFRFYTCREPALEENAVRFCRGVKASFSGAGRIEEKTVPLTDEKMIKDWGGDRLYYVAVHVASANGKITLRTKFTKE